MKLINETLLDRYRGRQWCWVCGKAGNCSPHHVFARGREDAFRMDIEENIMPVCIDCHSAVHNGMYRRLYLLDLIGQRIGMWANDLEDVLLRLRHA